MLKYCDAKYKTQEICHKAIDDFLPALTFFPDTSKMIKKLSTALYTNENMLYFNEDNVYVEFYYNEMGNLSVNLNNIMNY